jgi:hypothetical protein
MWLQKEKLARQDATLMSLERFQLPFSEKPNKPLPPPKKIETFKLSDTFEDTGFEPGF